MLVTNEHQVGVDSFKNLFSLYNEKSIFKTEFFDDDYYKLIDEINLINDKILNENAFSYWKHYLNTLLDERNKERKNIN